MKNTLKRTLSFLLSAALLCALAAVPAGAAAGFSDVPNGAWYTAAVKDLTSRGIMSGKGGGRFEPNSPMTRAEFTTMLAKTALSEEELSEYKYRGNFSDVGGGHWANKYINWANDNGIVSGSGGKFNPSKMITRQDMAVMLVNYSRAMCIELPPTTSSVSFADSGKITRYARESVEACVRAGIIKGDNGYFRPTDTSRRCEAAQMFSAFLKLGRAPRFKVVRRRVGGVSVSGVSFDPMDFTPNVVMGGSRVNGGESVGSLIRRAGAEIAVNGAFFDMESYAPYGTIVKNRELVTTFNNYSPQKSAIIMDGSGRWSVENFFTYVTLTAVRYDGSEKTAKEVAVNRRPSRPTDGSRIIFTRAWGSRLGFAPKYAVKVDKKGFVTDIYHDTDVEIPESGYLIVQQADRQYQNEFISTMAVGSVIDKQVEYRGSSTQDIKYCVAVGPRLVKGGRAYGDSGTYAAEGLDHINNFSGDVRVCMGVKPDGDLVIVTAYASLPEMSKVMVGLGCDSAVNLDGGGSANLYAGGLYFTGPRERLLNNVLTFR